MFPSGFPGRLAPTLVDIRDSGHTIIEAPTASAAPFLRIPPLHSSMPRPTLELRLSQLDVLDVRELGNLTAISLQVHHHFQAGYYDNAQSQLAYFGKEQLPSLRSLRLGFPSYVWLDFSHDQPSFPLADLSQLHHLSLHSFSLSRCSLLLLAWIAPNLTSLVVQADNCLPLPVHPGRHCWDSLRAMHLEATSSVLLHTMSKMVVEFPPNLRDLTVISAASIPLPLRCSNFNSLSQLTRLMLAGMRFQGAFMPARFQLHALRHVTLMNLDVMSSDYSFPAKQIGLRCLDLELLTLVARIPSQWDTQWNSTLSLCCQITTALTRKPLPLPPFRMWARVPLVLDIYHGAGTEADPLTVKLVRA